MQQNLILQTEPTPTAMALPDVKGGPTDKLLNPIGLLTDPLTLFPAELHTTLNRRY